MEPSSETGAQPGEMRRDEGAVAPVPGDRAPGRPFRVGEGADLPRAMRRVGEAYWPEGVVPEPGGDGDFPEAVEPDRAGGGVAPFPESPPVPPPPPPMPPPMPVAAVAAVPPTEAAPIGAVGAPGIGGPADAMRPEGGAAPAMLSGGTWGEAGGFPRPPKSQVVADVRGPVFFDAAKDPVSILMAVLLAGVVGGLGTYLGWRLGAQEAAQKTREETERRLALASGEWGAREQELSKQLQEARARVAEVERANAAVETQGKEREKALAALQAAAQAQQEQIEALKKAQSDGEGASARVADLVALRGEQERLLGLLREAVGEACEVGADGAYVFARPKAPLYAEGTGKPSDAVIGAIKKVAGVVKAYDGPYRLQVEGHTDASPGPTAAGQGSNLHAGAMRALDIAQVLVDSGVPASKMTLVSQGEAFPLRTGDGPAVAKANRRVEIIFAPTRAVVATALEVAPPAGGAGETRAPRAVPVVDVPAPAAAPATPARDPVPAAPAVIEAGTTPEVPKPQL